MVRLERVNKYFFRKKKNEIHVIDNSSLEMEGKGLVALLGPSGSGKTTLLNAIGGLDQIDSGRIFVNGEKITGRFSWETDRIRAVNIGYIFQDYNLIENMTVFDNVAIALRMTGSTDPDEIREKVNYVLDKVGMYRYRNRYADMLSGGERQRVGIARAIVKDPAIIIADEPTGNLDSRNTLEVMNIIRAIAEEKLVILVTHEEKLADFYASRIIRIKDGRILSDRINDHSGSLDYRVENKIYLREIKEHKRLTTKGYNVDFYNDSDSTLDVDIVLRNGNIYIRANNPNDHIEVIDENSGVEFIDDYYRELTREETMGVDFDLEKLKSDREKKYRSILNPLALIRRGFKSVSDYNTIKKVLLAGFVVAAMFITYAVSMFFGVLHISDNEFAGTDKSYLTLVGKNISVRTYTGYEQSEDYRYVMPGDSQIRFMMPFDDYIQTKSFNASISGSLSDIAGLKKADIIYGRIATADNELVIDRMLLQKVIDEQSTVEVGAGRVSDFLNRRITVENMGDFELVGICDKASPCIYAQQGQFVNLIANSSEPANDGMLYPAANSSEATGTKSEYIDYQVQKGKVQLVRGKWPEGDYEVAVNDKNRSDKAYKIGKELNKSINGHRLRVVGYYEDPYDSDLLLVNNKMVKYDLISKSSDMTLAPVNKGQSLVQLRSEGVNVKDAFQESRDKYIKEKWSSMKSMLVMAGIILAISFIEIYLMIRASFLSRIKEVGVYRAIGVRKSDIYMLFSGEIIAITTIASLPGFLFMALVLYKLSALPSLSGVFMIDAPVMALCFILVYGLNLLFGLLPVWKTIRHTPAEILSRTDIG